MSSDLNITRRTFTALAGALFCAPRAFAAQVPEFWNYYGAGNELEAAKALLDVANSQNPDTPISNRIIPGSDEGLWQQLQVGIMGGSPPAVSQFSTGYPLRELAKSGNLLNISEIWGDIKGDQMFSEGMRRVVSIGSDQFAIPLSASILGNCFYNKSIFDKLSLKPPTSWDEFGELCNKIKAAGLTPLAASSPPGFLFYQTYGALLTVLGTEGMWSLARGDLAFTDPMLRKAFTLFKERVAVNFSKSWAGSKWSDGIDQMMRGETAMYIIGDWGSGYMEQRGWKAEVEYDFFPVPGFEKVTIFQADVVVAYKGAQEKAALNFLKSVASAAGQEAFNKKKGSLAPSAGAPSDFYNPVGKREFDKMTRGGDYVTMPNPYLLLPTGFHREVAVAVERYASTFDEKTFDADLAALEVKHKSLKDAGKFVAW
ncbi:ABC transporter substrate-binding protein [Agrobacterium tumefaciens]|uniref:ABC transporter substrate-binding protein n=1 Tax=Agrobacterium tumefaciens TaxID=358 RepID=UPI002203FF28|nr:extracellular solute-binding protein [Agrobacterium tumefaciens]